MSLTDDDKKWIEEVITTELETVFEAVAARLDVHLAKVATMEALRDVETTLLAEFHKWASPREMRQQAQTVTISAIEMELVELRERIAKLEPKQ